ncbi:hypothetical protein [Aneurinibacillus terranovensis]|uniref:hypothetical protein n=1 Tax=Aneurinibacillus terranovensis TaxID=278991 RepID=UPI00041B2CC8
MVLLKGHSQQKKSKQKEFNLGFAVLMIIIRFFLMYIRWRWLRKDDVRDIIAG